MGQAHFPVRVRQETPNQRPPSLARRSLRERLASPAADGFVARRISPCTLVLACFFPPPPAQPVAASHPLRSLPCDHLPFPSQTCLNRYGPRLIAFSPPQQSITNGLVKLRVCCWPPPPSSTTLPSTARTSILIPLIDKTSGTHTNTNATRHAPQLEQHPSSRPSTR